MFQADLESTNSNLLKVFILGFLGGFLALLTPCVFPMIPLTVSFFTKQSKQRSKGISSAVMYGLFIVAIYLLLSVPFHFLNTVEPQILNTISTNIYLNLFFFLIFVFFAFSFFGYYELTLPYQWSNKMDSASSIGGTLGVFFMALTLALVSFSCTGPILGSLLVGTLSSDGGAMQLSAGMAGFGVALALPFTIFALFPNLLNNLPKSGRWLNNVKVFLGFVELALALKFLSNADLVGHWGILKREIFIGIWVIIFAAMVLYFFNIIRFPHDPKKTARADEISFGILTLAFVLYLISGLQKQSHLALLSGFPPPTFYSIYGQPSDCPLELACFKDFEQGLEYARISNKPILLDFTGWACVNCRKMEENVWSDPTVYHLIQNDYVLISLYVDDRQELSDDEKFQIETGNGNKRINTVGDKWSAFQQINFQTASQPYYVTLDPSNLRLLNNPIQYTDIESYEHWLYQSRNEFQNKYDNS